MTFRKAIVLDGVSPEASNRLSNVNNNQSINARGIFGDPILEPVPKYIKTSCEKVIEHGHNSWIVLGRDRPKSRLSGYGGQGHTHCASIDVVVGRLGGEGKTYDDSGNTVWADPDFEKDAARIYISQKTDVDDNFGITRGSIGNPKGKSAIAIKADGLRLIGREGIKLVTKIDKKNSQGGDIAAISGIDLIAGNKQDELQPMMKGENTQEAMRRMAELLDKLNGIVHSLLQTQMTFNEALTHHWHYSPFFGLPTTPSVSVVPAGVTCMMNHLSQTLTSLITHKTNISLWKSNYLLPAGKKYILSRWNNNN